MLSSLQPYLVYIGALGLVGAGAYAFVSTLPLAEPQAREETAQTATVNLTQASPLPAPAPKAPEREKASPAPATAPPEQDIAPALPASTPAGDSEDAGASLVARIRDPYPFPPLSFQAVNELARAALVNILCTSGNKALRPISGSGVIIDPRGIIITNAHVAQYVLLSQSSETRLSCAIRSGSPARPLWSSEMLYIPPVWVREHAADITESDPTGTGEHDYALLRITGPWDPRADSSPESYPALPTDIREAIAFPGDPVLAIAYPSEFIGSTAARFNLHPISSITAAEELLTFRAHTADLISFKGAVEAQSGASGGPIVNAWGYVVGIITTTSEGETTAERELHALALGYIDRDLAAQTGAGLEETLRGDAAQSAARFKTEQAPALIGLLMEEILKESR
ncbi:hypothetical protein A3C21_01005 [Candidatus Kaiserbacteria bacterium RIFCSPHIGHO2_02_FULL_59_21]|uniref:Serine protease n=1 Tax=Candidatus Kaiserbacteria bacterium RIFCSPHIGHO2_02_FULL_59_21 TaxID=1798500 RepID=A0A1F6E1T4_9BACT|nr:MAG: hypothetical protein A3C21_01005 [Candidatus Kaiserbacteria bacterium RIFCSPHIGHO2_02_FULL_59_21]OGG87019.1 MAG: hypothetical protein A3I47_03340 [Candidatus Kaiserbacteria bacterium RIFCSPLOWO2_02_FULL_59_19]